MTKADREPILVGIGVAAQREDDPRIAREPLALMIEASRRAGFDSGAPQLLQDVGRILVPKGRWSYGDPAREIGRAIGAKAPITVLSTVGVLQQSLISRACPSIAEGETEIVLVVGGDTGYRLLRSTITGIPASETPQEDTPDILLSPRDELRHPVELRVGLKMPLGLYAMIESAFRAKHGWTIDARRDQIAARYSRFSEIAADNPDAWTRKRLSPEAIRSPTEQNSMQAFPYTKLHCSSWSVDQAAALLFCSTSMARSLGIMEDRWIYPWAASESNHMVPVTARAELDRCPGARIAGDAVLEASDLAINDVDLLELYSCFPVAVDAYAAELGIDPARDLTVTGGMSFAGGPYNNYVLQATCRMAHCLRQGRGRTGLISSVSGVLTKQGFAVWSTQPAPQGFHFRDVTDSVARDLGVYEIVPDYVGPARIAGYTVLHERSRPPRGVVIADVGGGRRVAAATEDPETVARMETEEFCGRTVDVIEAQFLVT